MSRATHVATHVEPAEAKIHSVEYATQLLLSAEGSKPALQRQSRVPDVVDTSVALPTQAPTVEEAQCQSPEEDWFWGHEGHAVPPAHSNPTGHSCPSAENEELAGQTCPWSAAQDWQDGDAENGVLQAPTPHGSSENALHVS